MTTYGAYDAGLPCKNPSCKSEGQPHPNCKCYGPSMAEGGEIKHYCSQNRPHKPECEYFAKGGEAQSIEPTQDVQGSFSAYLAHHGAVGLLNKKLNDLTKYESSISKGHKKLDQTAASIFDGGETPKQDSSKSRKQLEDWLDKGGAYDDVQNAISQQDPDPKNPVQNDLLSRADPESNLMFQTAKGRVSDYLSSLKPKKNQPKLAFDSEPDDTQAKKHYNSALDIASDPLSVFDQIKKGTAEALHVKHLNMMFPELSQVMQKKVTDQIMRAQLEGKRPAYPVRQGLSMLMGTPLSGELSPQGIQAAQATFQPPVPPPQPGQATKPKKSTSKLSKSDQSFMTGNQALTARSQKQ